MLDDADRAPAEVRAALRDLAPALGRLPVLVLATGQEAAALARLEPDEALVLEPLDADASRAIAALYAPAGADAVPVEALLATSRGVARRVHEAASEWARREATRRVDAVAGRAAAGRSEARALEDELAGSVVELQSARERADRFGRAATAARRWSARTRASRRSTRDDAEYFFGRERLVAELVARLVGAPLLAVVGPSGSGKSSVVRAGLLPALAGGVLPGSDSWTQARDPPRRASAARAAARDPPARRERRGVLVGRPVRGAVHRLPATRRERAAFVAALVRVARDERRRRGASPCAPTSTAAARRTRSCRALLGANHVLVGAMSRDELRRAIERPARAGRAERRAGARRGAAGRRRGPAGRAAAAVDGAARALAPSATAAACGSPPTRAPAACRARSRAWPRTPSSPRSRRSRRGAHAAAAPRRRGRERRDRAPADRAASSSARIAEVVARLTERRLLTVSDGTVEVAHEALLREWPRLRGWLDEDAEGRRLHRRARRRRARLGRRRARPGRALPRRAAGRGARLGGRRTTPELNATERAFLDDSRRASGRAQRRLRLVLAGVASLLGRRRDRRRGRARPARQGARPRRPRRRRSASAPQALAEDDLDRSLLLARQGVALQDSPQTRGNLLAALLKSPAAIGVHPRRRRRLKSLALSPDGRTLAILDADGTLRLVDARTRRPVGRGTDGVFAAGPTAPGRS